MNKVALKQQLQDELTKLRQRVADLEAQESKRKRVEDELKASRDYLDHIVNGMFDAVMVIDKSYKIVDVNSCFEKKIPSKTRGYHRPVMP